MRAVALRRPRNNSQSAAGIPGAKRAPYPGFIQPCDTTLRDRAPDGSTWLHEIKIDGYRAQVHIHHGRVSVYSRSGYDWTTQFGQIAHAAEALPADQLILDGEATVLGKSGLPDLQGLRRELAKKHSNRLVYLAFDLLFLDGYDLRGTPLIERKRALQGVLATPPPKIVCVEFLEMDDGEAVYRHACKLGLEGIVSKWRESPYRSGRQESWLKLKCTKSDTFPIVAFVEKLGARPAKSRRSMSVATTGIASSMPARRAAATPRRWRGRCAAVGAYSPRARDGFPIAAPVTWKQVEGGVEPAAFTMRRPGMQKRAAALIQRRSTWVQRFG